MKEFLLSREQWREVKRLRFDDHTEAEFQESVAAERIRRIQVVLIAVVILFVLAPTPKEVSSTPIPREAWPRFAGLTDLEIMASEFRLKEAEKFVARRYGSSPWQALTKETQ